MHFSAPTHGRRSHASNWGRADPIGQRRPVQLDAGPLIDRLLPIERAVVGILGREHLRQQSWRRDAALDRTRRCRQLHHPRTVAAGELGSHMAQHLEVARHEVEHLGDILPQLAHGGTAVGAGAARRRVHDRFAWQVGREAAPHRPQTRAARWRRGHGRLFLRDDHWRDDFFSRCQLQIGQRQLQLQQRRIRLLRGTTEAPPLQARNLDHQFGDHLVAVDEQTLQRRDVIGQSRNGRH
jgi:hypothetical protein